MDTPLEALGKAAANMGTVTMVVPTVPGAPVEKTIVPPFQSGVTASTDALLVFALSCIGRLPYGLDDSELLTLVQHETKVSGERCPGGSPDLNPLKRLDDLAVQVDVNEAVRSNRQVFDNHVVGIGQGWGVRRDRAYGVLDLHVEICGGAAGVDHHDAGDDCRRRNIVRCGGAAEGHKVDGDVVQGDEAGAEPQADNLKEVQRRAGCGNDCQG